MPSLTAYIPYFIAIALLLVVLVVKAIFSPELKYHSFWYKLKAKIIFWCGRIHRLHSFPWVTWSVNEHKMDFRESRQACTIALPGDIGLHKDEGFFSNLAIPGAFKHAWIVVDDNKCVEAIQKGVLHRDHLYPLISDYAIILRPRNVTKEDVKEAVRRAISIVGCDYDANFNFNFEESDKVLAEKYTRNLAAGAFHPAFSCTETVAFSWYHKRDHLRIFRSIQAGREAVVADDFLKMNYDILWMSESVTLEWATKMGMHEEGRQKIKNYLATARTRML